MALRDPYRVLGVEPAANAATIKAAWRRLAREHHPDLAPDEAARDDATRRMAEINAAYEELRTPAGRSAARARAMGERPAWGPPSGSRRPTADPFADPFADEESPERPSGPPPPPPKPVTARFDTTVLFRPRNATVSPEGGGFRHRPRPRSEPLRARIMREDLRASIPNGPIEMRRPHRPPHRERPTVAVARATEIAFGKFAGWSLGAIAVVEPTYLDWVAKTVNRDPDLVAAVRVVLADLGRPVE